MGKKPDLYLDPGDYHERREDMKRRHNLFWDEVTEGFLRPRIERRYRRPPGWLRRWTGGKERIVALRITDMVSDPLVMRFRPDRYDIRVMESPPQGEGFEVRLEKVCLMNIGYGNRSPLAAFLLGDLEVVPMCPLRDKIALWRLLRA